MEKKPTPEQQGDDKNRPQVSGYARYTGMAFQMGAIIAIGILLGQFLDKRFGVDPPYFTILGSVIFTGAAIYIAIKDFLKP